MVSQVTDHISKHLLVYLTLAFIAGIIATNGAMISTTHLTFCYFLLLVLVIFVVMAKYLEHPSWSFFGLLFLVFTSGFYLTGKAMQPPQLPSHIFNIIREKSEVLIIGTMRNAPEFDGKTYRIRVATDHLRFPDKDEIIPCTGQIFLQFQGDWPAELRPGDTLAARAEVKRPESYQVPGVFDYAEYLALNEIWLTGFVRSPLFLQKIAKESNWFHTLHFWPERLRMTIGEHIDNAVPQETRGIYRAILIGDTSRIDPLTMENFKNSGLIHILSISGLHMTVLCTFLYFIFYFLLNRSKRLLFRYPLRKFALALCLPLLLGYSLLAGLSPPVIRSVAMSCVAILAICTDRPKSLSPLLAAAALFILSFQPLMLFTPSFQLSFLATAAILFLVPTLHKLIFQPTTSSLSSRRRAANWLIASILVSFVATLVTMPITLYFFNRFSLVGIFANVLVEPLICLWSLIAGFIAIPFIFILPKFATFLLFLGSQGLIVASKIINFSAGLPLASVWRPTPSILIICFFFLSLLAGLFLQDKGVRWRGYCAVTTVMALMALFFPHTYKNPAPDEMDVTTIDVGQGSASLVQMPSGFTALIDGGGYTSPNRTVGEQIIAPFLWKKGLDHLDAVIVTHPDSDHYNGLPFIFQHFRPTLLWLRDAYGHEENFRKLVDLAQSQKIAVVIPMQGMRLDTKATSGYIECVINFHTDLEPAENITSRQRSNEGLVIKTCYQGKCVLFPGDIGRDEERLLVRQHYDLQANLLLAAHHGSITSNSPEFLAAVSPQYAIVSAGKQSHGHFPHPHLQDDCDRQHIAMLTTSQYGTIEARMSDELLLLSSYRKDPGNPFVKLRKANVVSSFSSL